MGFMPHRGKHSFFTHLMWRIYGKVSLTRQSYNHKTWSAHWDMCKDIHKISNDAESFWKENCRKFNLIHRVYFLSDSFLSPVYSLPEILSPDISRRNCTNEVIWQFWDRKIPPRVVKPRVEEFWNSLWVTKGTSQFLCKSLFFPMNGLAGVVKKKSSTSGEAASGGFFFYHNC